VNLVKKKMSWRQVRRASNRYLIFTDQKILAVFLGTILLCTGCSTSDPVNKKGVVLELPNNHQKNTRRFLVIGIGIITVSETNSTEQVIVADQTSLGIYAGNTPGMIFGAGYQSSTLTAISDPEQVDDIRIEVTRESFGKVKIVSESVKYIEPTGELTK
jgi:hypothetical protein